VHGRYALVWLLPFCQALRWSSQYRKPALSRYGAAPTIFPNMRMIPIGEKPHET